MSWAWLSLEDVLVPQNNGKPVQQGWSPRCHAHPAAEGRWGVLKTTAVQSGWFDPSHNKELPDGLNPRPHIEVKVGDLLMTCAGPRSRCGVPALVRNAPERLLMSGKMYRFRPTDRILPKFLEFWLLNPDTQGQIDAMKTGISDSGLNLTQDRLLRLPVPVPPIAEQHRIVEALEDHFSRLDAAEALLGKSSDRLAGLRDRVLTHLLQSVAHQRWSVSRVLRCKPTNGRSVPTAAAAAVGFPVLRLTSIRSGEIDLRERKIGHWNASDAAKYLVKQGDILLSRGNGSLHLVGRAGIVAANPDPIAFPDTMIRLSPDLGQVLPQYLVTVWNAADARRQIESAARTTAGIYKINQSIVGDIEIPVPDLDSQRLVIHSLSTFDESSSRVVGDLADSRHRCAALRRSLLSSAFKGELVDQDPNYEPAKAAAERLRLAAPPVRDRTARGAAAVVPARNR